jgi:hypothetical protein
LYSSIRYLGEDTDFDTKLVAWTGEILPKIRRPWERKKRGPKNPVGVANGQLDDLKNGEPTLTDPGQPDEPAKDLVCLTKADKRKLEEKLKTMSQTVGSKCQVVPIWTLEDADGQPQGTVAESPETQSRWRKYPEQGNHHATF